MKKKQGDTKQKKSKPTEEKEEEKEQDNGAVSTEEHVKEDDNNNNASAAVAKQEQDKEEEEEEEEEYDLDDETVIAKILGSEFFGKEKQRVRMPRSDKDKREKAGGTKRAVLYLGHIPHGFFEFEIHKFLSQFGDVVRVRVSRSQKTGKSRGYAFIQLQDELVADIVQKTLHGYILLGRSLVCQHVPEEHVHDKMFLGALYAKQAKQGRKSVGFQGITTREASIARHNAPSNAFGPRESRRLKRLVKADDVRRKRFKAKGIDYEFKGYHDAE